MMQDLKHGKSTDLMSRHEVWLSRIGIWPKTDNDVRFAFCFVYMLIHVTLELGDLIERIDNLQEVVVNLSETTTYLMLLLKMIVFRKNPILREIIDDVTEDRANEKDKTINEQNIYAKYNSMARIINNILVPLSCTTSILYFFRPLGMHLLTTSSNGTTTYVLPFRNRMFNEITDVYTYALVYAYQSFTIIISVPGYMATDVFMTLLTLHVCGKLAVLAENITAHQKVTKIDLGLDISDIVKQHLRLIRINAKSYASRMAKNIDTAFTMIQLFQLIGISSLITLNAFNVIVNSDLTQTASLLTFAVYEITMLGILYSYCFIGEHLVQESKRVHDAFYQCPWMEMPPSKSKCFVICMARSRSPLYLTAGKIYIFSLENFTKIIKTAIAYLSVLRTMTTKS